ncbi:MAG: M23 family metallopeptidase, partial [Tissierellia bacterium]|nr:M23 family metallopeptidase [Tissierellia bacterium]
EEGEAARTDEEMVIVEDEDDYVEEYTEPNLSVEEMVLPVYGTIDKGYTENNLVYSETLDKWMAHKGIDILAPLDTPVVAALAGTVQEVYEDPLWGMVVVISHGDSLLTKYASLSEDGLIQEGASVNKGDVVGKVGNTAAIEMMMEPHIHFEVIEDGISINPSLYIPSIAN